MIVSIVLDVLFPKHCLNCGKEGAYICKDCELFMNEVGCAGNLISFWEYNGVVKEAIKQIKYKGVYDIVRELINKKDFEVMKWDSSATPQNDNGGDVVLNEMKDPIENDSGTSIITYVPMHIKKKKKRGFNQAEIIAKEIGKKTGVPVAKLLEKIKPTRGQAKLDKEHRLKNLVGAIHESPETKQMIHERAIRELPLQNVLIVDDVYTTGATMAECTKVLYKAGFKNISYFTIARAV